MLTEQGFSAEQNNMTSVDIGNTLDGSVHSTIESISSVTRIFFPLSPEPRNQTTDASLGCGTESYGVQSSSYNTSASQIVPPVSPSDTEVSATTSSFSRDYVRNPIRSLDDFSLVGTRSSSEPRMQASPTNIICSDCQCVGSKNHYSLCCHNELENTRHRRIRELLQFLASLRFGRVGLHGCHEDLSIVIHDMSFLELLALEARRITGRTNIPEEEFSELLTRMNFATTQMSNSMNIGIEKNTVCVICQDEYVGDDVLCQLPCDHSYHFNCIRKWILQMKWCPVCKTVVSYFVMCSP